MNLIAKISMNSTSFVKGVGSASSALGGFIKGGLGKLMSPIGAAIGGVMTLGSAVMGMKKAMSSAAEMEDITNSFVTLLGSADAAKKRMEELTKFAAETPFEMPDIAKSSKILQSLTDGALATGKGLQSVGDMAAMAGVPMSELSVTVGRLYNGLTSGKAVGESIARMSELGLMSSATREKLEQLQKAGKKGDEVWQVAAADFAKYAGEMQRKSQGWNGLISTLGDNINLAFAAFGQPVNDALKPFLSQIIGMTDSLVDSAASFGQTIGNGIAIIAQAWSSGILPSVIKDGMIVAYTESLNYLLGGLRWSVDAFGASLWALLKALCQPEFWAGIGDAVIGAFQVAAGELVSIFMTPITYIRAAIEKAIQEIMAALSKTKVGRKVMGISGEIQADDFDTIYKRQKRYAEKESADLFDKGVDNFGASMEKMSNTIGKNMSEAFGSVKFEKATMASDRGASERLAQNIQSLKTAIEVKKSSENKKEISSGSTESNSNAGSSVSGEKSKFKIDADRLTKIGGFIGGSSTAVLDFNRKTATNTLRIAEGIDKLNNAVERGSSVKGLVWA